MKILALTPWDIRRNDTGGTIRCNQLLTAIPGLTTFAIDWTNKTADTSIDGMPYRVIPAGARAMEQAERLINNQGLHSYDAIPTLCRDNMTHVDQAIDAYDPDLIIVEHPWLVEFTNGRPYVYDAHNFETSLTAQLWGRNSIDFDLVRDIEHQTIIEAEHVTYCSQPDWEAINQTWPTPPATHIPNGTIIPKIGTTYSNRNLIFIGSMYGPNINAAQHLADLAKQLPEYHIHLIGDSSRLVETIAPNVTKHGHVTQTQLEQLLMNAHMLVNLTTTGSGTHLKIPQALAYGIPVVSLPAGARGYEHHVTTTPTLGATPDIIRQVTRDWREESKRAKHNAKQYDWQTIRKQFAEVIHALT